MVLGLLSYLKASSHLLGRCRRYVDWSATVTGNVAPTVYIHKWFVDGVQDTSATTNTFKAKEGRVSRINCVLLTRITPLLFVVKCQMQ